MATRTVTCSMCMNQDITVELAGCEMLLSHVVDVSQGDLPVWDPAIEDLTTAEPIELPQTPPPAPVPTTPPPAPKKKKSYKKLPIPKPYVSRRKPV